MIKKYILLVAIIIFCQSCKLNTNSLGISDEPLQLEETPSSTSVSQSNYGVDFKILDFEIPETWESEIISETYYTKDWKYRIPQSFSYAYFYHVIFGNDTEAIEAYKNRIENLNKLFSDHSQVNPSSQESAAMDICGNEATVRKATMLPSSEFGIIEETEITYVFFIIDDVFFEFNLELDRRDITQHNTYKEQFWEMIDSIECPVE